MPLYKSISWISDTTIYVYGEIYDIVCIGHVAGGWRIPRDLIRVNIKVVYPTGKEKLKVYEQRGQTH